MNPKNILIWSGAIIATFILLFFAYKLTSAHVQTDFSEITKVRASDHTKWSKDNKNVLVEYSDFQCPACKSFHEVLKSFEASSSPDFAITQKITLIFRYYPLYQIHKNSLNAAYAAEAAGLQGKFWEMGNKLFEKQDSWRSLSDPKNYFFNLASELKLDLVKFQKDLHSQSVKDKVQNDLSQGEKIGINETPTFFLNGKKVEVNNLNEFKQLLISL